MKTLLNVGILILLISIFSCHKKKEIRTKRSMYIWTANTIFSNNANRFLDGNKIENLYIRYFDVDWDNVHHEIPISELFTKGKPDKNIAIIPVIYIKNKVFRNIEMNNIDEFADKLHFRINFIHKRCEFNQKITEVQFDCDWTKSTRDKYFKLLKAFKKKKDDLTISATIRLHQVKYQKNTGVPPVDKAVLMYYNMGNFKNEKEKSSILNNKIGKQYINENSSYPLEMSLALPVFSWTVWKKWDWRLEKYKFHKLIASINESNIDSFKFISKRDSNLYEINTDTVYNEYYFRNGEELKLERPDFKEILKAKTICKGLTNNELILFSFPTKNPNFMNKKQLNTIYKNEN